MNAVKLLNLAPMLIMGAFLAYSGYSIHASADDPAAGESRPAKVLDAAVPDTPTADNALEGGLAGALRDPFQVSLKPGATAGAAKSQDDASLEAESDRLAKIVQGLKLDATFLQGHDQMAIINGRIYSKGHHLLIDAGSGGSSSTLLVVSVLPAKVILRGGNKDYVLGYPDQLALSQKPVNSPVVAPVKSTIAKPAGAPPRSGSAPRTRHSRGSRAGSP
jgi:hypothetical protein